MIDSAELRTALGLYATGVTVVTCRSGASGAAIGITANSFTSVSLDPPLISWALSARAYSLPVFKAAGHFAVHVLAADQEHLATGFARQGADKFAGLSLKEGAGGAPLIEPVLARFECRMHAQVGAGDHVVFFGEVVRFDTWDEPPLVFLGGRFVAVTPNHPAVTPYNR